MKAQKQVSKLEATASILDNLKTILITVIGLAVFIGLIVAFINSQNKSGGQSITTAQAQAKCMLIDEYNQVNELGKEYSQDVVKEAERHCLAQWDSSDREEAFKESVAKDWEIMKNKNLNGYTLEQLYDEANSK